MKPLVNRQSSFALACVAAIIIAHANTRAAEAPRPVRLDDLLRRVAGANLNVAAERSQLEAARFEQRAAWGILEPQFTSSFTREANRRLNSRERFLSQASPLFDERNNVYGSSLEFLAPVGTKLRIGGEVRDLRNNLQVTGQNEWDGFAGVSATQPLLRGFGMGVTLAPVRVARAG